MLDHNLPPIPRDIVPFKAPFGIHSPQGAPVLGFLAPGFLLSPGDRHTLGFRVRPGMLIYPSTWHLFQNFLAQVYRRAAYPSCIGLR
jgi:hypothetical protein